MNSSDKKDQLHMFSDRKSPSLSVRLTPILNAQKEEDNSELVKNVFL